MSRTVQLVWMRASLPPCSQETLNDDLVNLHHVPAGHYVEISQAPVYMHSPPAVPGKGKPLLGMKCSGD